MAYLAAAKEALFWGVICGYVFIITIGVSTPNQNFKTTLCAGLVLSVLIVVVVFVLKLFLL